MQRPNNRRLTADSLESPARHMPSTGIRIDISAINTDPRVQKECESREQQLPTELHDDAIPAWGAIRDRTTSPPRYIRLPPIRQGSTGALPPLRRTSGLLSALERNPSLPTPLHPASLLRDCPCDT